MDRNVNSINNFSNHSITSFGGFARNSGSASNSQIVLLNDIKVIDYLNNQESIEGFGSNQNGALTSYGGGQFGLGQRLHGLRRSGDTLISFSEVRNPLFIDSNAVRQSQPLALIPVSCFSENARNSVILSSELNSPSFTSTNILSRPPCQNPTVFVSKQVAVLKNGGGGGCCCCHGQDTTATPSYFLKLTQNSSHHQYPNNCYRQTPMKSNSTINPVLLQRPLSAHQGIVFSAAPIARLQAPNSTVDLVTSAAVVRQAEPRVVFMGTQKRGEQVEVDQNHPSNRVSFNENVGDQNDVSADGRPVGNQVGDIFLGNDGRTHSLPRGKDDPYTCPRCKAEFQSSQTFATHMSAEHYKHEPAEQRLKRRILKSHGRSNHISHPSEVITQIQAKPLFKQTSMGGVKISTDKLKKHIAEALRQIDGEQSCANTVSQGHPSQMGLVDGQKNLSGVRFNIKEEY